MDFEAFQRAFDEFPGECRREFGALKWCDWNAGKWDPLDADTIPMWVADMDCQAPLPVREALKERIDHGVFGYELPSDELRGHIVSWMHQRYAWAIQPEDLVFLPGLVSGLNLFCRAFGEAGAGALVLTPIYPPIRRAPTNHGMFAREVPLTRDDRDGHVRYRVDFTAIERVISEKRTRLLIVSHPHNPIGQELSTAERVRLGELCDQYDLVLCSDEVHCDLRLDGTTHEPNAKLLGGELGQRTVTLMSPSKSFNLPGLSVGFAVVENERLRKRLMAAASMTAADSDLLGHVNALALTAAARAYGDARCHQWLDHVLRILERNRDWVVNFIKDELPRLRVTHPTTTYLCWLDCGGIDLGSHATAYDYFLKEAKVKTAKGESFGPGGERFVRLNFACPKKQLDRALANMADALPRNRAR
jgi:cystathionine beta-lyase